MSSASSLRHFEALGSQRTTSIAPRLGLVLIGALGENLWTANVNVQHVYSASYWAKIRVRMLFDVSLSAAGTAEYPSNVEPLVDRHWVHG